MIKQSGYLIWNAVPEIIKCKCCNLAGGCFESVLNKCSGSGKIFPEFFWCTAFLFLNRRLKFDMLLKPQLYETSAIELVVAGKPMEKEDKVGIWKCPYHNGRACLEIIKRIQAAGS